MSDEAKVRELFAPMQAISVDVDSRRFKVDREKVITAILNAPKAARAARAARSRRFAILAIAAGVAVLLSSASWLAVRHLMDGGAGANSMALGGSLEGQLHISEVSGQVTRRDGTSQVSVSPGAAQAVSPNGELFTAENPKPA